MSAGVLAAAIGVVTTSRVLTPARPAPNVVMQNTRLMESRFPRQGRRPVPSRQETRATSRWSRFVEGGDLGRIMVWAGAIHEQ